MADLLFDWFVLSCFAYFKSTTDLLVRWNPNRSKRRSDVQWYVPLRSKWLFFFLRSQYLVQRGPGGTFGGSNRCGRLVQLMNAASFVYIFLILIKNQIIFCDGLIQGRADVVPIIFFYFDFFTSNQNEPKMKSIIRADTWLTSPCLRAT